eukprot:GFYU01019280.1.p1 GENE.GFYU01019280.1~~GFYU01019280.1.p1  ORF type:complete len:138 (+),score=40.49 GFYU01019280.1:305-718(+)
MEQCLNLSKTGVVQSQRAKTAHGGGESFPIIHGMVFDPATGHLDVLKMNFDDDAPLANIYDLYNSPRLFGVSTDSSDSDSHHRDHFTHLSNPHEDPMKMKKGRWVFGRKKKSKATTSQPRIYTEEAPGLPRWSSDLI